MDEVNIERAIGRLEGKIDLVVRDMSQLNGAFHTLEAGRLSRLETNVASLTVRVSAIAAAIPILIELAAKFVFHL